MVALPTVDRRGARLGWMDALRGMALTLVILDHAAAHTLGQGFHLPGWVIDLTGSFDPLRMPLMAFLSGTLLSQSLAKGTARYLSGKARNILYPYLLWTIAYTLAWVVASPLTGTQHQGSDVFWNILDPPGHLWFVYYLFFFYLFMLILERLPRLLVVICLFLAAALFTWADYYKLERFFFLFAFFVIGHHATRDSEALAGLLRRPPVLLAMGVLALGMPVAAVSLESTIRYEPVSIPVALAGIGVLVVAANRVGERPGLGLFRYLGRNSLPAYILHWMIIAVIVIVSTRVLHVTSPVAVFALCAAGGYAATLAAVWLIKALHLGFLFAWPKSRERRRTRGLPIHPPGGD